MRVSPQGRVDDEDNTMTASANTGRGQGGLSVSYHLTLRVNDLSSRLYRGFGGLRHVLEATLSYDPTSRFVFDWLLILPMIAVSLASRWARKCAPLSRRSYRPRSTLQTDKMIVPGRLPVTRESAGCRLG
jgi:hypothetical protein